MSLLSTPEIRAAVHRSVLCWLATTDANGQPNVSPKEIFALTDDEHIVAQSYRLYPTETTEASQVEAALRTYGVNRNPDTP
jgi:hypothetical protein